MNKKGHTVCRKAKITEIDILFETREARRRWNKYLKVKLSFWNFIFKKYIYRPKKVEIKPFPDIQKLKKFMASKPALQEMVKSICWAEGK